MILLKKVTMTLEKKFAALEKGRTDFPKGRRLQPVSGGATNTLVWQCEFPDMDAVIKPWISSVMKT
jgi:hypothetical protein